MRRARAKRYAQQEDDATKKWLAPNLLRLFKGTLSKTELVCRRDGQGAVPVGAHVLLFIDTNGVARVVAGNASIGTVSPTSMPLLRQGIDEAAGANATEKLNTLHVEVVRVSAFDEQEFCVRLHVPKDDDAA